MLDVLLGYTKGQQATFKANTHYWAEGQPYLDEIDFKVGVDDNAALQQVEAERSISSAIRSPARSPR